MELNLNRPVVFFDLETTGLSISRDHIVEICLHKVMPDHSEETRVYRIRPADVNGNTLPIPPETTAIHGISDADVADKPTFAELAKELADFIGEADLAGYNSNKFDVPMLVEEFLRANIPFDTYSRRMLDVQNIFHKMEQRTLKAAYRFYCDRNLDNAHSADADTLATYEVLKAQLDRYQDAEYTDFDGKVTKPIVNDMDALSRFTTVGNWADLAGFIHYDKHHREILGFGKHKGKLVEEVFTVEPAYYDWMIKSDFPISTKVCLTTLWNRMREKKKLDDLKQHFGCNQK